MGTSQVGSVGRHTIGLSHGWWAGGLALAQRCPAPARPVDPGERALRRLVRWREAHEVHGAGPHEARLAQAGLDDDALLALLAEDRAALAARTEKPGWATVAEEALARAPVEPPKVDVSSPLDGFAAIVAPFAALARHRLARHVAHVAVDVAVDLDRVAVVDELVDALSRALVRTAARTLVLELNVLRVTDRLDGDTTRERFASFVRHFAARDGLAALLDEYPVLARLLAQATTHAVEAHRELLDRFAADRAALVDELLDGVDPGRLVEATTGSGDGHRRGRSVGVLRFAGGARIVYKPRPLAVHAHLNDVLGWLDERMPGLAPRRVRLLDRGCHGWLEYIEQRPCHDEPELDRYYHRQGALLALLYALDGCDFHHENVIAHADQPVLIDLEALFHPPPPVTGAELDDPASAALAASVQRVGLLPAVVWNADGAVELSGLGGDGGLRSPYPSPAWAAAGTDEMHLIREFGRTAGQANRPTLRGEPAEPATYLPHLLAGFRAGYTAIVAHRADLLRPDGPLAAFAADEVRVIARATQVYATLLTETTHPDVLRDGLDRDRALGHLWAMTRDGRLPPELVAAELDELWSGDVPLLVGSPGSALATCGTAAMRNGGPGLPLARVAAKVRAMGPRDLRTQEWVIRAAMATRVAGQPGPVAPARLVGPWTGAGPAAPVAATPDPAPVRSSDLAAPDPTWPLEFARRIADGIADAAHVDGDRAGWLGLECAIDAVGGYHWSVAAAGTDLSDGGCGIALFLGQLAALTGEQRYADLATSAMWAVPRLLDAQPDADLADLSGVTCGAFDGLAGPAYAAARLGTLLGDATMLSWVGPLADAAAAAVVDAHAADAAGRSDGPAGPVDVMGGAAGCLAAMVAVHRVTGLDEAWRAAQRCADHLLTAEPLPDKGFAHGDTGVGWALSRFAAAGGGDRYARAGLAALAAERANRPATLPATWCRGAAGLALAAADRAGHTDDPLVAADLDWAIDAVLLTPESPDHSLCHGDLGIIEALSAAVGVGRRHLAGAYRARVRRFMASLDAGGPRCGTLGAVHSHGMLTGLAGIGYGLLRIGCPERVPCVLTLDT